MAARPKLTPWMIGVAIGESTTFFIFSALCVVTYVFVWFLVPETKGRSLEEIQERWVVNGDRMLEEEQAA